MLPRVGTNLDTIMVDGSSKRARAQREGEMEGIPAVLAVQLVSES